MGLWGIKERFSKEIRFEPSPIGWVRMKQKKTGVKSILDRENGPGKVQEIEKGFAHFGKQRTV